MSFSRIGSPDSGDPKKKGKGSVLPTESDDQVGNANEDLDQSDHKIKSQIAVHDRTQLEAVFDYPLLPAEQFTGKNLRYAVEAYFYFPRQMGITSHSYPKERFYADLRPLIRLREPRLSYRTLTGLTGPGVRSPINIIRHYVSACKDNEVAGSERAAVDEARIFGCSFASYFLRRIDRRTKRLKRAYRRHCDNSNNTNQDELGDAISKLAEVLSKTYNMLRQWRLLYDETGKSISEKTKNIHQEIHFVDEYCTYRFRDGLARLIKAINSLDEDFAGPSLERFKRKLTAYARLEHWYAERAGFQWVDRLSSSITVENYVHRRGALKRRVWRVLYLNIRIKPLFSFQQQLGAMVAAGVAAIWAVAAEVLIRSRASDSSGALFKSFGDSTFVIVMIAFVLAYVLKDRIKELGRSYFKLGIFAKIPDNSEGIWYLTSSGQRWKIGSISEFTRFLRPKRIPAKIIALRREADPDGLESEDVPEDIIRYRKVITLHPSILQKLPYPIRAVHDILRLNVQAFLSKLDDPHQESDILDADGRVIDMKLPKVYHLDIVLKYSKISAALISSKETNAVYDHIRLVVNKEGLHRVERLS